MEGIRQLSMNQFLEKYQNYSFPNQSRFWEIAAEPLNLSARVQKRRNVPFHNNNAHQVKFDCSFKFFQKDNTKEEMKLKNEVYIYDKLTPYPFIVDFFGFGIEAYPFICTKWVGNDAITLENFIRRTNIISGTQKTIIATGLANVLTYMHQNRLILRNLHPAHIALEPQYDNNSSIIYYVPRIFSFSYVVETAFKAEKQENNIIQNIDDSNIPEMQLTSFNPHYNDDKKFDQSNENMLVKDHTIKLEQCDDVYSYGIIMNILYHDLYSCDADMFGQLLKKDTNIHPTLKIILSSCIRSKAEFRFKMMDIYKQFIFGDARFPGTDEKLFKKFLIDMNIKK